MSKTINRNRNRISKRKTGGHSGSLRSLSDDLKVKIIKLLEEVIEYFGIKKETEPGLFNKNEFITVDINNENFIKLNKYNKQQFVFKLRPLYSNNPFNYEINKRIFAILTLLKHESMDISELPENKLITSNGIVQRIARGHLTHRYSVPLRGSNIDLGLLSLISSILHIPIKAVSSLTNNWQTAYDDLNTFYTTTISQSPEYLSKIEKLKTNLEQEIQNILDMINK
jgi:hypothetical protein